jgi:hypothetical protein
LLRSADDTLVDEMTNEFHDWFAGKQFTTDWTTVRIPTWDAVFGGRRAALKSVLEIGAWEGRSTVFFLNYFPQCSVTCIDTFAGGPDFDTRPEWAAAVAGAETRFDANTAEFSDRVIKLKAASVDALAKLAIGWKRFHLVYVDGGHRAIDAYRDATLAWTMLLNGGVMIMDDYQWNLMPDETDRPRAGIDAFLSTNLGRYRELHRGYQVIVEKT